jgi:exonuclease III
MESKPAAKRCKSSSPTSIVTWNCNGLISRCQYNAEDLKRLVQETNQPDCLCFQEVRLKAFGSSGDGRGKPKATEYEIVRPTLSTIFGDYIPYWSLSDARYAGTLTLLHKRLGFTPMSMTAFTPKAAITVLLNMYGVTRADVGLLETTATTSISSVVAAAATAAVASPKTKTVQTCLKSYFATKPSNATTSRGDCVAASSGGEHHHEGRFQFFAFDDMDLMQTYVPNNGTKEESFQRRRQWDQDILDMLLARRAILQYVRNNHNKNNNNNNQNSSHAAASGTVEEDRLLIWCGDMNCTRDYRDGTHWWRETKTTTTPVSTTTTPRTPITTSTVRLPHGNGGTTTPGSSSVVHEWWTDESKCFVTKPAHPDHRSPEDRGMPSFTPAERQRFANLLRSANLVDVWREFHPSGSNTHNHLSQWDRPDWTWRGHLGKEKAKSKYEGRGQRLDYFLLSPYVTGTVKVCEILGYGTQRQGLFCGSDHCASILVLNTGGENDDEDEA